MLIRISAIRTGEKDVKIVSAGEKGLNLNYAYEMRDVKFADTKRKKIRSNEFFGKR